MLETGIKGTRTVTVNEDNTAKAMGSGTLDVFATPALIASTASPYKFAESVGQSTGLEPSADGFAAVRALHEATGVPVEKGLKGLENKPVRHTGVCEIGQQAEAVLESLK